MPGIRLLLRATAIASLIVLCFSTTASAHERRQYIPDGLGYGGIRSDHLTAYACDTKADGWGVRTRVWFRATNSYATVGDANGSSSGCGSRNWGTVPAEFQVCTGPSGADYYCTGWWSVF